MKPILVPYDENMTKEELLKATEQIETLVEAYDGFPPQVQIKGCHDCTINIYPSQTKFYEQTERSNDAE